MNILIVKTSALGDIVHTFPAVGFLKKQYPHACIDWVVENSSAPLLQSHPQINNVIVCDTKQWRKAPFAKSTRQAFADFRYTLQKKTYDLVFDLQGNSKSAIATWLAKSPTKVGFSWNKAAEKPNALVTNRRFAPPEGLSIREEYLYMVQSYCADFTPYMPESIALQLTTVEQDYLNKVMAREGSHRIPLVMVSPGSNWINKQVNEDSLLDFLRRLQQTFPCYLLLSWGSEEERLIAMKLQNSLLQATILDKMSLPVLQNLMGQVSLVIAMDSLPLHLAATTATATYSIFGPSLAAKYQPQGSQHSSLQGPCPYNRHFSKRCPLLRSCATGACIRSLEGETLFNHFKAWITTQPRTLLRI